MEREHFTRDAGVTHCEAYLISGFAKLLGDGDISGKMTEIGAEFPREENSAHLSALQPSKSRLTGSELSVHERIVLCPHAKNIWSARPHRRGVGREQRPDEARLTCVALAQKCG